MKLEKLREIASKRTTAQWKYEPERYSAKCVIGQQGDDRWIAHFLPEGNGEDNAKFSVTVSNHIDALLDLTEATINMIRTHYLIQGNRAGKTTLAKAYAQIEDALARLEAIDE